MSAQYKKRRSCYGINLVPTEKAESSKQGCLEPWKWWGQGGKAARRARGDPGDPAVLQPCYAGVGVWQSLNTNPECWALAGFLWRHAIVLQEFFVLAACFCWPSEGRGRSLVSQPQHSVEVGNGGGSRGRLGAPCWLRKVGSQMSGTGKMLACHWVRLLKKLKPLFLSPSASLSPPFLPAPLPTSPLSTLDHLHQVDIRRVYSGVCNCILSPVLHYQPWKWNLIIPDQFLMYKMIWPRFKGSHNWNQVNDTCRGFFFSSFSVPWFDFSLRHTGRCSLFLYVCACTSYINACIYSAHILMHYPPIYILCTYHSNLPICNAMDDNEVCSNP